MIFRYRLVFDEPLCLCGCDISIFYGQGSSHTAAVAGVQFDECQSVQLFILQFLQYAQDVHDTVRGEIIVSQQPGCFPAGIAPADADPAGAGERRQLALIMPHMGQEERIYILDGDNIVDITLLNSQGGFCVGYFGGTR